ncbi:hypothetical protein [Ekhidna sp.]|uniref:hypothetical protein n=1 Tax=Ekhidna sp. TaxID=2608089 RepID=UPI003297698C
MFCHTSILSEEPNWEKLESLGASVVYSHHKQLVPLTQLKEEDIEIFDVACTEANDGKYILVVTWKSKTDMYY